MKFDLVWYQNDGVAGEVPLKVTAAQVRQAFQLGHDEYPGDCLEVTAAHVEWLEVVAQVKVDLSRFDYFVEVTRGD